METSVKITLIIAATIVLLVLIGIFVLYDFKGGNTVSVQGQATVKAMPDLITVYLNVQTKDKEAKVAKDKNSEISDAVITELVKLGFERKEIVTESFNLYPEYDWSYGNQKIIGYVASNQLKVQLSTEKKDKVGDVIDAGVDAGATISYINFELSPEKQNQYKAESLRLATEDARIKAEGMASGLGKKLGKLVSISDRSFDYSPWQIYRAGASGVGDVMEAKEATTNIQPGEQTINANVQTVFKII